MPLDDRETQSRQNGAEPVYGPGYRGQAAGESVTSRGRAVASSAAEPPRSVREENARATAPFDGPSPPYTAPYPPYPSDVPDTIPLPLNIAAALAYLVAPALVFLLIPPYRSQPLLRFHSWQAIFYFLVAVAAREVEQVAVSMLPSAVAFLAGGLLLLVIFAGWFVAVIKALQGEEWLLPLVGKLAQQTARVTSMRPK